MPDPRSVMQEFRTLDAKRLAKGLSPEEERRLGELRDLVGTEAGAPAPRGGFDVNAAAARLRESLLPAGLRNRPPPPPELSPEPEPEPFFPTPTASAPAAVDAAPAAPAEESLFAEADAAALFDPATLGWDSEPDAAAQPPYDPGSQDAGAWDAGSGFDPNAAGAPGWDPSALPGDAGWDPATAPMDASGRPWDASASPAEAGAEAWDPGALAADPYGQPWDPNALPVDAAGQAWDPNALAWDPGTAGEPAAAGAWDPNAFGEPAPEGADGAAWDPGFAAELELEPTGVLALGAEPPSATPGDDLAGTAPPLELDAGALELEPIEDGAHAEQEGVPQALISDPASAGWTVPALDAAVPDGFALDDAAAETEPTEMLGLASEPEPTQTLPLLAADPAPLAPAGWDPAPAPPIADPAAVFGDYDALGGDGAELTPVEGLDGLDAGLSPILESEPPAPPLAPAPGELGEYDDTAGFAPGVMFEPPLDDASPALDGTQWPAEGALDPSFELASGGSFDATAEAERGWATAEAAAPWQAAPVDGGLEPLPLDLAAPAAEPELAAERPALASASEEDLGLPEIVEEIPTIDGAEILEEIPPDEPGDSPPLDFAAPAPPSPPSPPAHAARPPDAPAPPTQPAAEPPAARAPPPCPAPASPAARVAGTHRVVVHTLEGTVQRGVLEDADLSAPALALVPAPGEAAERIATDKVKAIFFMLAPGEAPPAAEGRKVRVTFRDGRQIAGFSPDYREEGAGFFMIPADTRTNTGRIWVYRAAVKQVAVS